MEILLAIVVASAVIFFGALISMGNERQRKAIDGLRDQVVLWAVQDLKIKRKHQVQMVQVPDPLGWLNKITSKACGVNLKLNIFKTFETPPTLVCASDTGDKTVIFSPLSPTELRIFTRRKENRLSQFTNQNPLMFLPKKIKTHEFSILNEGAIFDVELTLAWKALTGQSLEMANRLWMYELI